jgi:protein gp37
MAHRFSGPGMPYEGLARMTSTGPRWTGEVRLVPERLADPLRWRKARRVFVNSMSDLFHEKLSDEEIAAVFGVMAAASKHTFQVLTKRPERMLDWFAWAGSQSSEAGPRYHGAALTCARRAFDVLEWDPRLNREDDFRTWPLPNVWLGVSVENQDTADERIPLLLQAPAAVRFVSYEPALGPVDFDIPRCGRRNHEDDWTVADDGTPWCNACDSERSFGHWLGVDRLNWIVMGCESGPGARPAEVEWFRSARDQCKAEGVAFFLKQAIPIDGQYMIPTEPTPGRPKIDGLLPIIDEGPGSKRTGKVISLPYLDGVQYKEFPR